MNKKFTIFSFLLLFSVIILSSTAFAAELLKVENIIVNNAVAKEILMPVKFNITVTNPNDINDVFEISSILDMDFTPSGFMDIGAKSSITVPVEIMLSEWLKSKYSDVHSFGYYIRGLNSGTNTALLSIKIVSLDDALIINIPATVKLSDKTFTITLQNKENMWLSGKIVLNSDIMNGEKEVTIEPNSRIDLDVPIQTIRKEAGKFLLTVNFVTSDYTLEKKEEIVLEPSTDIKTDEKRTGSIFLYEHTVDKTNIGNVEKNVTITISKNIFSSWFTTFSKTPDTIETKGLSFQYSWTQKVDLDEVFSINVKTDYSLPLTVLFILLVSLIAIGIYMQKQIIVTKRTYSRIKTSTGGFALRILLHVKCIRGEARNVTVSDVMPIFASLHEKTSEPLPDRKSGRTLSWNLGNMMRKEERTISYVLYSNIKIVGKIELPDARGSYVNKKGHLKHVTSNKVFILAEEQMKDE